MAAAEIGAALTLAKQSIDAARLIYNSKDAFKDASVRLQMADLMTKLADMKLELSEVQELLAGKDREISELKKAKHEEGLVRFIEPSYWKQIAGEEKDDGPFCQRCWDVDRRLLRLKKGYHYVTPILTCTECETTYVDPNRPTKPEVVPIVRRGSFMTR